MNVVPLRAQDVDDTVSTLEYLLAQARNGQLLGVAICAKFSNRREEISFTGDYMAEPALAVNASLRMSVRMAQLQEDIEIQQH